LAQAGGARERQQLATTLLESAAVARDRGELRVALARAREALELARALVAREPRRPSLRRLLGGALLAVGGARSELGEPATAEHDEALASARSLAARDPEDATVRAELRDALVELGQAALARRELERARDVLEEAVALARPLQAQDPANVAAGRALGLVLEKAGQARESLGDLDGARAALEEALAIATGDPRADAGSQAVAA